MASKYERKQVTCPLCGGDFGNLPMHLTAGCDGGSNA